MQQKNMIEDSRLIAKRDIIVGDETRNYFLFQSVNNGFAKEDRMQKIIDEVRNKSNEQLAIEFIDFVLKVIRKSKKSSERDVLNFNESLTKILQKIFLDDTYEAQVFDRLKDKHDNDFRKRKAIISVEEFLYDDPDEEEGLQQFIIYIRTEKLF
jgi:hypothetical protein